jgi:hypothetical protein
MPWMKVTLVTHPGRKNTPEYADIDILTQHRAHRPSLPTRRNRIGQRLS